MYDLLEEEFNSKKRNYRRELLSNMTNSEIMDIIIDMGSYVNPMIEENKRYEKRLKILKTKSSIEWYQLMILLNNDRIEHWKKIINSLKFELDSRKTWWKEDIDLNQLKRIIPITDVITTLIWKDVHNLRRNLKCPFPDHNDWTASFHIYENTNTFKCFWCHKQWSQIDFIKYYNQIDLKEAIKIFTKFK